MGYLDIVDARLINILNTTCEQNFPAKVAFLFSTFFKNLCFFYN